MGKKTLLLGLLAIISPQGIFLGVLRQHPSAEGCALGGRGARCRGTRERGISPAAQKSLLSQPWGGYWAAAGALPASWLLTVQGRHLYALLEKACPRFGSVFCFSMDLMGAVSSWCLPRRCCWRDPCATATKELSGYRCHLNVRQVLYYCIFALHNHTVDF